MDIEVSIIQDTDKKQLMMRLHGRDQASQEDLHDGKKSLENASIEESTKVNENVKLMIDTANKSSYYPSGVIKIRMKLICI